MTSSRGRRRWEGSAASNRANRLLLPSVLLAVVFACGAAEQLWLYRGNLGMTAPARDGLGIFFNARSWGLAPSLSQLWGNHVPLMTALGGAWMKMTRGGWVSWLFLQAMASWLSCCFAGLIAWELFHDEVGREIVAAAAFALAALHPFRVLNSMGSMEFPWVNACVLAGVYCWLVHRRNASVGGLFAAAACFFLGTLAHYEGWLYAAIFSLWLLVRLRNPPREGAGQRQHFAALTITVSYMLGALWHHYSNGEILGFLRQQARLHAATGLLSISPWETPASCFASPFAELLVLFPVLCAMAALALFQFRRRENFRWSFLLWPLGGLTLLGLCHIIGLSASFITGTRTWSERQLLTPVAAGALLAVPRGWRRLAGVAAVATVASWSFVSLPSFCRNYYTDWDAGAIKSFALVRELKQAGLLPPEERILAAPLASPMPFGLVAPPVTIVLADLPRRASRFLFSPLGGKPGPPSDSVIMDRFWNFKGDAFHFRWEATAQYPSVFTLPSRVLKALLRKENIKLVVASGDPPSRLDFMIQAAAFPPYRIYAWPEEQELLGAIKSLAPRIAKVPLLLKYKR